MTAVIAVQNQKGGVGKTTTTFHLGGSLAKRGRHVLLIDTDPQASLTNSFFGPLVAKAFPPSRTTLAIAAGREPSPDALILKTAYDGLDIIPGTSSAKKYNAADALAESIDARCRLRDFLDDAEGYDLVLIDGPPNLQLFAWQSFSAASHVLIPTTPDDFGAQGLEAVLEFAAEVRARGGEEGNAGLKWLGTVLNMVNIRSANETAFQADMRELYPDAILTSVIKKLDPIKAAITARIPAAFANTAQVAGIKPAAKLFDALAVEILERIEGNHPGLFPAPLLLEVAS